MEELQSTIPTSNGFQSVSPTTLTGNELDGANFNMKKGDISTQADEAINSGNLVQSPDMVTTPAPAPVSGAGLQGAIEKQVENQTKQSEDAYTANLKAQEEQAKLAKDEAQQALINSMLGAEGETTATAKEYAKRGGVDKIQEELDSINSQIMQEQHALRRQTEAIQDEAGLTATQKLAQTREVTRTSLRTQADLAVVQMSIQGRYDSAKAIADRAVKAQMEQQQTELDVLGLMYQDNKDMFTTAEQRSFESAQADRQRKLDNEEADLQAKYDLAIEAQRNGAPTSVVNSMLASGSKEEALGVGGGYVGLLDRQSAQASIRSANQQYRLNQLKLAAAGDKDAIAALGYDPANPPLTGAELQSIGNTDVKLQNDLDDIDKLIANNTAIELSAGQAQGGFLTSVFETGVGSVPGKVIKEDFLNEVKRFTGEYTLDNLIAKKAQGATFGALSNAELGIISASASKLNALLITDSEGNITGISGSEEGLRIALQDFKSKVQEAKALNNSRKLSDDELAELYQ